MGDWLAAVLVGLASGVLSGMFGIGGGILTTPAIRLLLDAPALIAVGTPLPVIIPGALTGASSYVRRGEADVPSGLVIGVSGAATAVMGAWATKLVGGPVVLLGTAALIVWAAADMTLQTLRTRSEPSPEEGEARRPHTDATMSGLIRPVAIGLLAGAYSGFFGLGGGFVIVPLLTRWLRHPIKRAIGTSLVAVSVLAVPGTISHALLGNVDWSIAGPLALGVVPGAFLGARVNAAANDRTTRVAFVALLLASAAWLAVTELGALL